MPSFVRDEGMVIRELHIFYLLDVSGSMQGTAIIVFISFPFLPPSNKAPGQGKGVPRPGISSGRRLQTVIRQWC